MIKDLGSQPQWVWNYCHLLPEGQKEKMVIPSFQPTQAKGKNILNLRLLQSIKTAYNILFGNRIRVLPSVPIWFKKQFNWRDIAALSLFWSSLYSYDLPSQEFIHASVVLLLSRTGGPLQQEWEPEWNSLKIHACISGKRVNLGMQV